MLMKSQRRWVVGGRTRAGSGLVRAAAVGVAAGLTALGAAPARADNSVSTWVGGDDVWSNPAGWAPPGVVPQSATNDAVIGEGAATLDASFSIGALALSGGIVTGT